MPVGPQVVLSSPNTIHPGALVAVAMHSLRRQNPQSGLRPVVGRRLGRFTPSPSYDNLHAPLQSDQPPPVVPMKFSWNF